MSNHESSSAQGADPGQAGGPDQAAAAAPRRPSHRRRVLVPAGIAVVAAAAIAVPALAAGSDLPSITAQQLLTKALTSHVQTFSGTVQSTVDLGLPAGVTSALPSAVAGKAGEQAGTAQAAQAQKELLALLSGGTHSFAVAADGQDRQRVESTDSGLSFAAVHNGSSAWSYDGQSNTATHTTGLRTGDTAATPSAAQMNPQQVAQQALAALGTSTTVSVAGQSKVAGQSVYELVVHPKGTGSTIGEVRIAVDAANGMPLQVRVNPSDGSDSILNVAFATVSFDKPAASTFDYTPPSGAKVTERTAGQTAAGQKAAADQKAKSGPGGSDLGARNNTSGVTTIGTGWDTIYRLAPTAADAKAGSKSGGSGGLAGELSLAKSFGTSVPGGTLISTKLVNVLVTDNGTVYAGAVTPALLEQAAGK